MSKCFRPETIWETDGTCNGTPVYCPTDDFLCPYYGERLCHIKEPYDNCDDYASFVKDWEKGYNDIPDDVDETGYDPYLGCYTEDC